MRILTVTLFALVCIPSPAIAQLSESQAACVRALPRSAYHRVGVGLDAVAYDVRGKLFLPAADILAQTVAFRVRTMLGGSEERIPDADTLLVSPSEVWGAVRVTAGPDGKFSWRASRTAPADSSRSALRLVMRALTELASEGEMVMWPEPIGKDPVTFSLVILRPTVDREGKQSSLKARRPMPLFMVEVPWEKPVELLKSPRIHYPESMRTLRITGGVELEFILDEKGEVVPGSVDEVWPDDRPKLDNFQMEAYRSFLRAVQRGLPSAEFSPALVGGCAVRQKVRQVFNFQFKPGF